MARVSKYPLDKIVEHDMYQQFWVSVLRLKNTQGVADFFSDILTDTEEIMLAKRFAAAVLLIRGKRPIEISGALHLSYTTIASVGAWVKNAKPSTRQLLTAVSQEKEWQKIVDRIDELLDRLPPPYGINWSRVGHEKREGAKTRAAHKALR